jgi:hypothetical protein
MAANFISCSFNGCNANAHRSASGAAGLCGMHYQRQRLGLDILAPKKAVNADLLAFVHDVAINHTGDECLIWPYGKNKNGYGKITVDGHRVLVTRYVCELTIGSPPSPEHEAAHSCGKGHKGCVSPSHLSWKTHAENLGDMVEHDTHHRGSRQWMARLTEPQVREILRLKGIRPQRTLAKEFGVSRGTICSIHLRESWSWLAP